MPFIGVILIFLVPVLFIAAVYNGLMLLGVGSTAALVIVIAMILCS